MGKPRIDGVGGAQPNVGFDDYEIIEAPQSNPVQQAGNDPQAGNVQPVPNAAEEFGFVTEDIQARDALQGAQVGAANAPRSLVDRLREEMPARHTIGNWFRNAFHALGRAISRFCHSFHPDDLGYDTQKAILQRDRVYKDVELPPLKEPTDAQGNIVPREAVRYTDEEIGAAFGIRHPSFKPFTARSIYPNGHPRLDDIRQDPELQDCWFLSTLGSVLASYGSSAIERLITLPENINAEGAEAEVKLGDKYVYHVKIGELRGKNGAHSVVSKSAPWVQILEVAMQMHRMRTWGLKTGEGIDPVSLRDVTMHGGDPNVALAALLGVDVPMMKPTYGEIENAKFKLTVALEGHRPVVLCSPDKFGTALSTSISPKHAVALLEILDNSNTAVILDPYGKIRALPLEELAKFKVATTAHV